MLLFSSLKQELAPTEDRGVVLSIFVGPEGGTIQYTDGYAGRLEKILENTADVDALFRGRRLSARLAGRFVRRPQGLGRAQPQGAGGRRGTRPEARRAAGRARVPVAAAVPGAEPAREADRGGDRDLVELRGSRPRDERTRRRAGEEPRPDQRRDRPQAEQAGAEGAGGPRPRGRRRCAGRGRRPHHGNHARRAAGHALQAERRAVRRDRADGAGRPHPPERHLRHLRARARRTRWCRSRAWWRCAKAWRRAS